MQLRVLYSCHFLLKMHRGAAGVFFLKQNLSESIQRALNRVRRRCHACGFHPEPPIPAIDQSSQLGDFAFLPAAIGFGIGILFLLALDHRSPSPPEQ